MSDWSIAPDGDRLTVKHYGYSVGYVRTGSTGYYGVNTSDYGHDRPVGPCPSVAAALTTLGVPVSVITEWSE